MEAAEPARREVRAKSLTLNERIGALRHLPRLFSEVWKTCPQLMAASIGLRLIKAFQPVLMLYVCKLIVDEIIALHHLATAGHDFASWLEEGRLNSIAGYIGLELILVIGFDLVCSKCGEAAELDEVIEAALKGSLWVEGHIAAMEGGDSVLEECPECLKETYAYAEGKCLNPGCDFSLDGYECAVCSEDLTLDDYRYGDGHLCSYHAHVMSKDD